MAKKSDENAGQECQCKLPLARSFERLIQSKQYLKSSKRTFHFRYKIDGSYDGSIETEKSILTKSAEDSEVHGLRPGVYYQFFVSANGEKGEGNTSTIVGHRISSFASGHQTDNGKLGHFIMKNHFVHISLTSL